LTKKSKWAFEPEKAMSASRRKNQRNTKLRLPSLSLAASVLVDFSSTYLCREAPVRRSCCCFHLWPLLEPAGVWLDPYLSAGGLKNSCNRISHGAAHHA
jgi:hypothetical protein